jgi:alkylation response protein AidB-like acyl-CoA dehydrogenase
LHAGPPAPGQARLRRAFGDEEVEVVADRRPRGPLVKYRVSSSVERRGDTSREIVFTFASREVVAKIGVTAHGGRASTTEAARDEQPRDAQGSSRCPHRPGSTPACGARRDGRKMRPMPVEDVLARVRLVAETFARDRHDRQRRRELDPRDFEALAQAGFLLTGVPAGEGGLFESVPRSTRAVAEILRALAAGDSSVALVSSMHPAVLSFWLATPEVPAPHAKAWAAQRDEVTRLAREGSWWGTITSEPGSGGDVARTRAAARPSDDGAWRLSGQKHFGSGSGVTSFMVTTAVPEGEGAPDWFFLDVRGAPWDGSKGVRLIAPWDGHGMTATQSHGMAFDGFPATRVAWPGNWKSISDRAGPFIGCLFTAVIVGIVETALATARLQLGKRVAELGAYDRVEWTRAEVETFTILSAYEAMLRAVETRPAPLRDVILGKIAIAELAESVTGRLCRIMGGGSFARHSPFGFWFEDVRALGWLRPPWALMFDAVFASSW